MNFDLHLGKAASVLFLALAMAGCGGGGTAMAPVEPEPEPMMHPVDLMGVTAGAMADAMAGKLTVAAGDEGDHGNITFACPADGDECMIAVMVADDGMVSATSTGGMATAMDSNAYVLGNTRERERLYRVTSGQRAAAVTAAGDAEQAVKDAADLAGKLGTVAVKGDSTMATMNAQGVLDAKAAAIAAVKTANDAKTALETAQTEAMALPDDENRASLLMAIGNAITEVETQIEMAGEHRDDGTLAMHVMNVEFPITDSTTDPVTRLSTKQEPAYWGNQVAMAIDAAVNAGAGVTVGDAVPAAADLVAATDVVNMTDNRIGMTFADIVGEDNLMTMRIDRTADAADSGTVEVMAASFDGMMLSAINSDAATPGRPAPTTAGETDVSDGNQYPGMYKGIAGRIFCAGDDCKVVTAEADDPTTTGDGNDEALNSSTLVGSWYFAPDDAKETYTKATDATVYSLEMDFVDFGYWFRVTDGAVTLHLRSGVSTGRVSGGNPDITTSSTPDNELEETANYSGDAVGLSVYRPDDDDDGEQDSISSGSFMAKVNLMARFGSGASPNLEGTVSNFMGSAVNPDWTVQLDAPTNFAAANRTTPATGTTNSDVDGATEGSWSATPAGPDGVRPTGFFGVFNANFVDGDLAGAYATRKN